MLLVLVGHGDPVGVSSHRGEAPWKGQQLCPLRSLVQHPELQDPVGLPGDGVEPAPQHRGPHVAAGRGHARHRGPGVGADVVGFHRGEVCRAIEPTHHINVVIEQSHASPCGEKVAQSHPRVTLAAPGLLLQG